MACCGKGTRRTQAKTQTGARVATTTSGSQQLAAQGAKVTQSPAVGAYGVKKPVNRTQV